jgi:hypothetical protein
MATFAFWASLPFIQLAALYAIISRLTTQQQDWIIASARYRSR